MCFRHLCAHPSEFHCFSCTARASSRTLRVLNPHYLQDAVLLDDETAPPPKVYGLNATCDPASPSAHDMYEPALIALMIFHAR